MPEERRSRGRRQKRFWLIVSGIFAGFLIAGYAAAAVYFHLHFYQGTILYGADCGNLTAAEAKKAVSGRLTEFVLQIRERGGAGEQLTAKQIGLRFRDDDGIERMLRAQKSYLWPVMMWNPTVDTSMAKFHYDSERVQESFRQLACMDPSRIVEPRDAYIMTTEREFVVVQEIMGTRLDEEKALQAIYGALDGGRSTVSLEEAACYINPKLYRDDEELQRTAAEKNELAGAYITYQFGDRREIVDAALIESWMVQSEDGTYRLDEERIRQYVASLAEKYDTFGLSREFHTSLGRTVTLNGGDYGWCIAQEDTFAALMEALAGDYVGETEPVYLYSAMSRNTDDIGGTYVEVCISEQRMWCYEDGILRVDTPVVTGNPNTGHATPAGGVWAIDSKMRQYTLRGEGYAAPVDYWMAFNGDVGIHDLVSRTEFGGNIYLTNGSHGCVNTPYEQAAEIYGIVSVGTPVIVYE